MKIFVVTGGRGFIGSHFVERALKEGHQVIDIDKMTYASNRKLPWDNHERYELIESDIKDITHLPTCDYVINFAAESHVDNSINSSTIFVESNIVGVHNLLEIIRGKVYSRPLFFQISTDEVYGDIRKESFSEDAVLSPSNPYSASKAAAEMIVIAYARTYGIPYVITRSSNNYGSRQYQEKLISQSILCAENNRKIPVHGDGSYVRDWIYVKDNIDAIFTIINKNVQNEIFNIGANNSLTNLEVIKNVMMWFGKNNISENVEFVENRMGQDLRYSVNSEKIKKLGWTPKRSSVLYNFLEQKE